MAYTDYLYFTTNASSGGGYCYAYTFYSDPSYPPSCTPKWSAILNNYSLQGMAASGQYVAFGNDGNTFAVIH